MFDVSVDMIIYIIIAFVVVVLDVLSIMDGKMLSNPNLNKKTSIPYHTYYFLCHEITNYLLFKRLKDCIQTISVINDYLTLKTLDISVEGYEGNNY